MVQQYALSPKMKDELLKFAADPKKGRRMDLRTHAALLRRGLVSGMVLILNGANCSSAYLTAEGFDVMLALLGTEKTE